jgi:predicted metal-dependent peptidase
MATALIHNMYHLSLNHAHVKEKKIKKRTDTKLLLFSFN